VGILSWFGLGKKSTASTIQPSAPAPDFTQTSDLQEKMHSGPPGINLPWFYPYYDPMLNVPIPPALLRKMFSNAYVKSATLGKLFSVASLDLQVRPHSKKDPQDQQVAEFTQWQFSERCRGGVPDLAWEILATGLIDGYSISEKIWVQEDRGDWSGKVILDRVKSKDTGNDVVLETDDFRNIVGLKGLRYNGGEEFKPVDFIIWQHLPFFGQATGTSDYRAAYSDWWMLDATTKLRMMACDKNAIPMLMGEYSIATQKPGLDGALSRARSQSWISVPAGVKVTVLNMAGAASEIFEKFETKLKHSIFLGIQGAILQSLEGAVTDSRGSSKIHKSQADLFKWYLSEQLQLILNLLAREIIDKNFYVQHYPKVMLSAVDVTELVQELAIDTGLNAIGIDLSQDETYDRYGRSPPEGTGDVIKGAPPKTAAAGGAPGPSPGAALSEEPVSILTAPPKRQFLAPGGSQGKGAFRGYSEAWQAYLRGA